MILKGVNLIAFAFIFLLHCYFYVSSQCQFLCDFHCDFLASRPSIVCIDSGNHDTICVSLALTIRFFDISINRYTPTQDQWGLNT